MKRRLSLLVGIVISIGLLVIILAGVDLDRVQGALAEANYIYLLPAALLLIVGLLTRAIRWRVLLAGRLPLSHTFNILNISYLFNGALPFRLGELVRLFLAARVPEPVAVPTTLSTILVERLLDLLTVIGLLGLVLTMLTVPAYVTSVGVFMGAAAITGLILLIVLARRQDWAFSLLRWFLRRVPWLNRWPLEAMLARFLEGIQPLASWRGGGLAIFWSLVSWGFSVVAGYILLYAFYPEASWVTTLFFIVMASLAVSVPYAPGAVGPYEAGVVVALTLTGFDQPAGAPVAFAIILHATNLGVYVLMGVLGLLLEGVSLGQVARGASRFDTSLQPGALD